MGAMQKAKLSLTFLLQERLKWEEKVNRLGLQERGN